MLVYRLDMLDEMGVVPRFTPLLSDELIFKARNETTNLEIEIPISWFNHNGRISFVFLEIPEDFTPANKYAISITRNDYIVFLGKMIIVEEDTDIQNYTPSKQITQRYKVKD